MDAINILTNMFFDNITITVNNIKNKTISLHTFNCNNNNNKITTIIKYI